MRIHRWQDLTSTQRRGIVMLGALQLALLTAALLDLSRREEEEINGSKRLWAALVFVNFVGPIAYFVFGRRRHVASVAAI